MFLENPVKHSYTPTSYEKFRKKSLACWKVKNKAIDTMQYHTDIISYFFFYIFPLLTEKPDCYKQRNDI